MSRASGLPASRVRIAAETFLLQTEQPPCGPQSSQKPHRQGPFLSPVSVEDTEAQRAWPGEQGGSSGRSGSQSPPCGPGQALPVSGHEQRWPSLSPGRSSAILTHAWRPRPWPSEAEAAKVQRDAGPGEAPAGGAWWGLEEDTELSARPPLPAPPLQACFQGHRVLHVPPSHSQRCRRCEATWGPPSMAAGWRGPPRGGAGGGRRGCCSLLHFGRRGTGRPGRPRKQATSRRRGVGGARRPRNGTRGTGPRTPT